MNNKLKLTALVATATVGILVVSLFLHLDDSTGSATTVVDENVSVAMPATSTEETTVHAIESGIPDLQTAVTDLCSGNPTQLIDDLSEVESQVLSKQFSADIEAYARELSNSPSAEDRHAAALMESNKERRLALLSGAIAANPNSAMLLWHGVLECSNALTADSCSQLRNWEQQLVSLDGQNSEVWVLMAANRFTEGHVDLSLNALKQAGAAAESRTYRIDTVQMIDRVLSSAGLNHFPMRSSYAFGVSASSTPMYSVFAKMCRKQSKINQEWAYACLNYGKRARVQNKSTLGSHLAAAIEIQALKAIGDSDGATAAQKRKDAELQKINAQTREHEALFAKMIFTNPRLFFFFLDSLEQHGELSARTAVQGEIERLLEQQPDLACLDIEPYEPGRP